VRRALIITYYWPPAGGSGVQRWLKFAKYLREFGYEPVIYTPENPEFMAKDLSLEAEIPEEVEVIKRKIWEPYSLYKRLTGKKDGIKPGFVNSGGRLSLFIRSNLFFPDPKTFWIGPSVKFLKKYIVRNSIDVIITTGPPHSMHIIGQKASKATSIPWIADFRDPWTKMYNFKYMGHTSLIRDKHNRAERKILNSADAVVTVTETIRTELEAIMRENEDKSKIGKNVEQEAVPRDKVFVVTNGYDESDFASPAPELESHFTITFTGLFVKSQNIEKFWRTLGDMVAESSSFAADLKIRLIGHIDQTILDSISFSGLDRNLVVMDYMPHDEVIGYQRSAQVLLLSVGSEPEAKGILTGKFFEYLAARRPIIAFGIKSGDIDIALEECSAGRMFSYDHENGLREYIEALYKEFEKGGIPCTSGSMEHYSRRELTRKMSLIMDEVINSRRIRE